MAAIEKSLYFVGIQDGLLGAIDSLKKGKKLTCRDISLPKPPNKMSGKEISNLREKELNVSQHIFALLLNVSPRTVQAWEQNMNTPSGPALRLLWLIRNRPDIIKFMLT